MMNVYLFFACLAGLFIETFQKDDFSKVADVENSATIIVKPGGVTHTEQKEVEGVKCFFTYTAQGGTGEEWTMTMTHSNDKKYFSCAVERPTKTSYLFFMNFKLSMEGAKLKNVQAFGNSNAPLQPGEYSLDKKENHIMNADEFKSQLAHIRVEAKRSKKAAAKTKKEL
ncbi:myeloid-derived growth factor-like [Tubulanus polymorphus]|uniref:myeloid-derived growth factor-like n=1 Tax=Tubulanus polymorphus TaxID=672921 RepID=UPI003DA6C1FB